MKMLTSRKSYNKHPFFMTQAPTLSEISIWKFEEENKGIFFHLFFLRYTISMRQVHDKLERKISMCYGYFTVSEECRL